MPKLNNVLKVKNTFVSVILLADRTTTGLAPEVTKLGRLLKNHYENYEIIVIDNFISTKEHSATAKLLFDQPCIRVISLSKAVTRDTEVFVGLESAIGDCVILLVPGYDPISLIPKFVDKTIGADLVFGISDAPTRTGTLNRYGAKMFYWYNGRYLGIDIPTNSTYYMAMNRNAVNALTRSGRHARHVRYLARRIGYRAKELSYKPNSPVLSGKRGLKALVMSAIELTTSYSQKPLRLVTWLGAGVAVVNLLYCVYVIGVRILKKNVAEGWTTLSLQSAVMFLFVFLILAVLSEYVGQILQESRQDPSYIIMDELNSKISVADMTRRNITH